MKPAHPLMRTPLAFTNSGLGRIFVGLSWDPREDKVGTISHLVKKDSQHDLDLCCYVYDTKGTFIDFVGAEGSESVDETGKIYHSGDNVSGTGGGDDETISAELLQLPDECHSIVFMAEVSSRHFFSEVSDPSMRIVDGKTNTTVFEVDMDHEDAATHAYFVFCSITRDLTSATGWGVKKIYEYPDTDNIEDWGTYLSQYA